MEKEMLCVSCFCKDAVAFGVVLLWAGGCERKLIPGNVMILIPPALQEQTLVMMRGGIHSVTAQQSAAAAAVTVTNHFWGGSLPLLHPSQHACLEFSKNSGFKFYRLAPPGGGRFTTV